MLEELEVSWHLCPANREHFKLDCKKIFHMGFPHDIHPVEVAIRSTIIINFSLELKHKKPVPHSPTCIITSAQHSTRPPDPTRQRKVCAYVKRARGPRVRNRRKSCPSYHPSQIVPLQRLYISSTVCVCSVLLQSNPLARSPLGAQVI